MFEHLLKTEKYNTQANQGQNYFLLDFCDKIEKTDEDVYKKVTYLNNELADYMTFKEKLYRILKFYDFKMYLFIVLDSSIVTLLCLSLNKISLTLFGLKIKYFGENFPMLLLVSLLASWIATFVCEKFSVLAQGSGIPEIKSVLSGVDFFDLLSVRTMWTKYTSICFVKFAGLGMGFEAAFVHITACLGDYLTTWKIFKEIRQSEYHLAIASSVSVGMVIAFGSPVGGVILALELFSANFNVSNLFRSFISGTIAYFFYELLKNYFLIPSVQITKEMVYRNEELPLFIGLGLLMGWIGYLFLIIFAKIAQLKQRTTNKIISNRYYYLALSCTFITILSYNHNSFQYGFKTVLQDVFVSSDMKDQTKIKWNSDYIILDLFYNILSRFGVIFGFLTSPIPAGIFAPGLQIGALIGRLYGEITCRLFTVVTQPQIFAVAGCAAWVSSVTKTFSGIIIVLEISKQFDLILPLLLTNLFAILITGIFNIGFFDFIISMRRLPYMPTMLSPNKINIPVKNVSKNIAIYLNQDCSFYDILQLFLEKQEIQQEDVIPIIGKNDLYLKGQVKFKDIFETAIGFLSQFRMLVNQHKNTNIQNNLYDMIFEHIKDYHDISVDDFVNYAVKEMKAYLNKVKFNVEKFVMNDEWKMLNFDILKESKNYDEIDQSMYRQTMREFRKLNVLSNDYITSCSSLDIQLEQQILKKCFKYVLNNIKNGEQYKLLNVQPYSIQVREDTPMVKIHYLFFNLRADNIFLCSEDGQLSGQITKNMFLDYKTN